MNANDDWQIAERLEPDTPGSKSCSTWSFADERYVDEFFRNHFTVDSCPWAQKLPRHLGFLIAQIIAQNCVKFKIKFGSFSLYGEES